MGGKDTEWVFARPNLESRRDVEELYREDVRLVISLEYPRTEAATALREKYKNQWILHRIPDPSKGESLSKDELYEAFEGGALRAQRVIVGGERVCVHCLGATDRSPAWVAAFYLVHDDEASKKKGGLLRDRSRIQEQIDYAVAKFRDAHGTLASVREAQSASAL